MSQPLQHIYIALGSNLGNKFDHLQRAVDQIFQRIGTIHKISSVYKSPALGFESHEFLNCVLMASTTMTANQVLKSVLKIEKEMGRERKKEEGYEARLIDIDLLFYGDELIKTKTLTVPHPEIPNRRFVLQPMAELNAQFEHPKLGSSMLKLLAQTSDDSKLEKMSKWLRNPRKDYDLSPFNYIAIEGNIGAGKTSLATQMSSDFNAKLILERFEDNPFLPKFYQDPPRYAFPLEMSFMADRYQQLLEDITQFDLFKECVVADYHIYKSLIFAQITLTEEEFDLFKKLFQLMYRELPKPDIYVYLYQDTDRLLQNIAKRGRKNEKSIKEGYLKDINDGYFKFMKSQHLENIKVIDITGRDFIKNRTDYLEVLKEILN